MPTIKEAIAWAREVLSPSVKPRNLQSTSSVENTNNIKRIHDKDAGINASLESQILLCFVLQQSRAHLIANSEKTLTDDQWMQYQAAVKRRVNNEPIAYIIGKREFWSLELSVNQHTLIPRPETELLVETALKLLPQTAKVADLGTGSGAIALALAAERTQWQITATDINQATLETAKSNAQQLQLSNVTFRQGEWCHALQEKDYDAIISNPPYIAESEWEAYASGLAFEPRQALVSGEDGLQDIRLISKQAMKHLNRKGFLLLEHGFAQGAAVRAILLNDGYTNVYSISDLANLERVTVGMLP